MAKPPANPQPIDPTLPLPVRNLIPQVPPPLLSLLLTHHVRAFSPQKIQITNLSPQAISLSYLQPVQDLCFAPVPRKRTINFTPALPPLPKDDAESNADECYEWESICARRLQDMESEAREILEGRSPIIVTRYLLPTSLASWMSIAQLLLLTIVIVMYVAWAEETPVIGGFLDKVFNKEWKFNAVAIFHTAILVKRWGNVLYLAKKLRKHQVDISGKGRIRGPWLLWLVNAFLEGWRCERRFDEEVERVGRKWAEQQEATGPRGAKKESKKKR